jgi:hypothetical protein
VSTVNTMLDTASVSIPVSEGGTGNATAAAYAVLCGGTSTTGALQSVSGLGTSGYILTSNGAAALPTWQPSGASSAFWQAVSGTSQAAVVETGYITQNSSLTTVTLPATAALGSTVSVQGQGTGGWTLAANTGQTIQYGQTATTSGGSFSSAHQYDNIQVLCIVANTTWAVLSSVSTGLTKA